MHLNNCRSFTFWHIVFALLLTASIFLFTYPELIASASVPQAGNTVFPGAQWETTSPAEAGFDSVKFNEALATLPSPAVVIRHGKIVGSKGDITRSGYLWSASKSLTSLIAARLIQQGHISYDLVVPGSNVPTNPPASYRQFMSMTSDFYLSPHSPGSHYAYNNGAVVHYGDHMKGTYFPGRTYEQMLKEAYLTVTGSEDRVGFDGYVSGWSGGWSLSTRDLARVGYLVLRSGAWNGQQIIPASFVNDLYQNQIPASATESPDRTESFYNQYPTGTPDLPGAYSFGFWLPHKTTLPFGRSNTEAIVMSGAYGTSVIISRAADLVIAAVNTSDEHQGGKIPASSLDLFAKAITGSQAPPAPTPTPTPSPGGPTVTSLTLINADTHSPIAGFNPIPPNATLNLATLPTHNLNIQANTAPATVGSVNFTLNGSHIRSEGIAPYTLAGDTEGKYHAWTPAEGQHVLAATAYDTTGKPGGSLTLPFKVAYLIGVAPRPTPTTTPQPPTRGGSSVSGVMRTWHDISLTIDGPNTSEWEATNPFLDYRLNVTFTKGNRSYTVPGYYAADGNAADSGASSGNKWRAHFVPDEEGTWNYSVSFRSGTGIAISAAAGTAAAGDGLTGSFTVSATDKTGRDHRGKGRLRYVGSRYLQFAGSGEYFIKGGADSPENFLAYIDFDQTPNSKHTYSPHAGDWQSGDPTWQGGKGKNIIGALNYLSAKGMNSVYFLTMNVTGDGDDVWPWTSHTERRRFDTSKLGQWEKVFTHMDQKGIMLHVVTQETENDHLLDGGSLGNDRKLYYRELIARFGHHLALVWNLGEENTNSAQQQKDFANYIRGLDPYDHPIVVHNQVQAQDAVYNPLLGFTAIEGPSIQQDPIHETHSETLKWITRSAQSGRQWVVTVDEIGPANDGVLPDASDPGHDQVRKEVLWGSLMAGGAGVEWYFGYGHPHNDLTLENWRSRDAMWNQTHYAVDFFKQYLPFSHMTTNDGLTPASDDYVLAQSGQVYAVYRPNGGATNLELGNGTYSVQWYNPRTGGGLQNGGVTTVVGPGSKSIGAPPSSGDWVALVRLSSGSSTPAAPPAGTVAVTSLTLINVDTNTPVAGFNPIAPGAKISLAALPTRNLNIRANTSAGTVGSVQFDLNGAISYALENVAPYALAGDNSGNYNPWIPSAGSYVLTVTPFSSSGASGTKGTPLTLSFTVAN